MKKILLLRHAKVDIKNTQKISSLSMRKWVKEYDIANIVSSSLPSSTLIQMAQESNIVLSSTLKRSIDSAKALQVTPAESNSIFNEALVPDVNIPFFKLKPKTWLVILRVLLIFGFGKKDASLKASKTQALQASTRLQELSKKHNTSLLVGHGGMNFLIRKNLLKEGWSIQGKVSNKHWGITVLTLQNYS